jgi:hypothetical protein
MNKINYRITLDAHKSGVQKTLHGFFAGDVLSRRIAISLVGGSTPCEYDEITAAIMYVTKPNGVTNYNACIVEENTIFYDVLQADIDTAGIVTMQFKVMSGESVLYAPEFAIEVQISKNSDTQATTTPTYTALEEALVKAEEYGNVAADAEEAVEKATEASQKANEAVKLATDLTEEVQGLIGENFITEEDVIDLIEEYGGGGGGGSVTLPDNVLVASTESATSVEAPKLNADTLNGQPGSYYATASSVTNITNGTTKVGNADKLDGNDSTYFATAASVTDIVNGTTKVSKASTADSATTAGSATNADTVDNYHVVVVNADPGVGVSVSYPNGTIIFVKE